MKPASGTCSNAVLPPAPTSWPSRPRRRRRNPASSRRKPTLRLNEQKIGYTTLRADQDGVITRLMAEEGSVVSPGQRVMSIARTGELEAVFDVPDARIEEIRGASEVQIALLSAPQARYPGRVREVSPSADPVTRTYQVRTSIPTPPWNLRLGMNVAVTLPSAWGQFPASRCRRPRCLQKDNSTAMWVVKPDLTLELRPVQVDRYDSDRVIVRSGLKRGDRVVTAGVHRLSAGAKVRLLGEQTP